MTDVSTKILYIVASCVLERSSQQCLREHCFLYDCVLLPPCASSCQEALQVLQQKRMTYMAAPVHNAAFKSVSRSKLAAKSGSILPTALVEGAHQFCHCAVQPKFLSVKPWDDKLVHLLNSLWETENSFSIHGNSDPLRKSIGALHPISSLAG